MRGLFGAIRLRLAGWTILSMGLMLLVLGVAVYAALSYTLLGQVDRTLLDAAGQVAPPQLQPSRPFPGPTGYSGGIFYVAIDGTNREFANPQQVSLTADQVPQPAGQAPLVTRLTVNGQPARVVVRPMPDGGRLAVGESLVPEQNALRSLVLVLLGAAAVSALLMVGVAWFLTGRALVPIQQAFQRQQEFVADASHELRSPLTVLQSTAELLEQEDDRPLRDNGELWSDHRHEIERMVRLTRDLLTLARSDRGELQLLMGAVEVPSLAQDVARRLQPLAQERGVSLLVEPAGAAAPSEPLSITADPDRLEQVLVILVDNALKHTPAGGRVVTRAMQAGQTATIEVEDTGEGIAPEHLARIFDRFYRADAARSGSRGGAGLGLAIARALVEAHQGHLALRSTLGQGTRVTIQLPVGGPSITGGAGRTFPFHLPHPAAPGSG